MKSTVVKIIAWTMCGTLTATAGIYLLFLTEIGLNRPTLAGVLLILATVAAVGSVVFQVKHLFNQARIEQLDASIKTIDKLQKKAEESYA